MKTIRVIACIILVAFSSTAIAKKNHAYKDHSETYGKTINVSTGLAYYRFIGETVPVGRVNYEFDIAEDITVAPFVSYFAFHKYAYPDVKSSKFRQYYRESVIPIGVTGYYYFDYLLGLGDEFDVYGGLSLGAQFKRRAWTDGYVGALPVAKMETGFYFDFHVGGEFHFTHSLGVIVDFSRGISTAGVAIHL